MDIEKKLLLEVKDFKPSFKNWEVLGCLNPGAMRLPNGKIVLYVRVAERAKPKPGNEMVCPIMSSKEEYKHHYEVLKKKDIIRKGEWGEMYLKDGTCRLPHISHFRKVILNEDGLSIEKIEQKPGFTGIPVESDYGVEDPRLTKIGSKYYMTYVGVSNDEGVSTYLAESKDLEKWKRLGLIFREQNKDVVLFPEKIAGKYVAFNRPESLFVFSKPSVWISYSKDLIYWGRDENLIRPRSGWETDRLGAGPPPIKLKEGWLLIYHGVQQVPKKDKPKEFTNQYCSGAVLLDLKDPKKILARTPSDKPLLKPTEDYEKKGYIANVIFPTGVVKDKDGKSLLIYSGGSDSVISVTKIKIQDILDSLEKEIN